MGKKTEEDIPLTKEYVQSLDSKALKELIGKHSSSSADLSFILESLGRLSSSFNIDSITPLLKNPIEKVRLWTVKTIGKAKSEKHIELLRNVVSGDESTMVRREAVSSIGRMRSRQAIPFLFSILSNEDPKIVCQAIRGLLVFKGDKKVDKRLKSLSKHENETVRTAIRQGYSSKGKTKKPDCPHPQSLPFLRNTVVNGDVLEVLESVPDGSVHLTFTSPPYYNARDYSIYQSYEAYLQFLKDVFKAVHRITKEGRFLIVNTSPVIIPRISRAHSSKRYPIPFDLHHDLAEIGWEFIDDIVWEKPEYSVKNRIGGFQQHRKPLGYKPNSVTEYLMVYRKQTDKLLDWNIRQYDKKTVEESKVPEGYETTNVWKISPKSDKVHSAIFPEGLCRRVIEYYSYKGDLVFDPFAGSGTLGRTARGLGRYFFLTEKEPKYFEYMKGTFLGEDDLIETETTKFLTLKEFKDKSHDDPSTSS